MIAAPAAIVAASALSLPASAGGADRHPAWLRERNVIDAMLERGETESDAAYQRLFALETMILDTPAKNLPEAHAKLQLVALIYEGGATLDRGEGAYRIIAEAAPFMREGDA